MLKTVCAASRLTRPAQVRRAASAVGGPSRATTTRTRSKAAGSTARAFRVVYTPPHARVMHGGVDDSGARRYRHCTDIGCLLLFFLYLIAACMLVIFTTANGPSTQPIPFRSLQRACLTPYYYGLTAAARTLSLQVPVEGVKRAWIPAQNDSRRRPVRSGAPRER